VGAAECLQPAFDGVLGMVGAGRALRRLCETIALTVPRVFLMR
jgi:hypothetical protein